MRRQSPVDRRVQRLIAGYRKSYVTKAMAKTKFRVGDKVKVVGMSPMTFAPGVKDELGTEKLFKSMIGKVYTVRGFDRYRNVELEPKRMNTVWVEPEFLKLRAKRTKRTPE